MAQRDIKKVLAYSTISQLGFMFLAVGARAYVAGVFHLMTHAFFKALLFLGAGSVIHAMSDEQDMHRMGGLMRKMPLTATTMAIGALALAGIPPLAGFWSKDEILAADFARGGWFYVLWIIGLVTALLTAFYIARLWVLVFYGEPRWQEDAHPHESPRVMTLPLIALAFLSVVGGLVNTPFRLGLEHFLEPSFEGVHIQEAPTDWLTLADTGRSLDPGRGSSASGPASSPTGVLPRDGVGSRSRSNRCGGPGSWPTGSTISMGGLSSSRVGDWPRRPPSRSMRRWSMARSTVWVGWFVAPATGLGPSRPVSFATTACCSLPVLW